MRSRILFISGHSSDARRLSHMLRALPILVDHTKSLKNARARLQQHQYDVILTDSNLPDGNWLDALHLAREIPAELEVVVTDPQADAASWSEALNLGAFDMLAQPFYEPEVRRVLQNACTHVGYAAPAAVL